MMIDINVYIHQIPPQGVCLAENESSLRTDEISRPKTDGSSNYGIFRVNSRYWCKSPDGPSEANGCNIKCDSECNNIL